MGSGSPGIITQRKKQLMIYFKTILSVILAAALLAATGVLPFALLHWGLGCGMIISILGAWVWSALVLSHTLLKDINSDLEEDE